MTREIEFKVDSWTPATIPLDRFGAYVIELAKLYGEAGSVHFSRMKKGSVVFVSNVDDHAIPKIERRLADIQQGHAAKDAVDVYRRIDDMLADDNAVGTLRGFERRIVITFPGRTRPKPVQYAAIREDGYLEGEIIRIGGKDRSVHLTLQSGETIYTAIETNRDMARRLGPLIFGPTIRIFGTGSWRRGPDGAWSLDRFILRDFEPIGESSLADAIDGIRAIGGSEWGTEPNPVAAFVAARAKGSERR
ncbi:hypothetical protein [Beijerinckia sp. L45]|uniref:hypothetical protein n=1 Tax=Beijerinckia sp. L45 TaxID=1641855 RepID=UPI00131EBFB3|nr:hypothetical protein [Beijerinckia sp. L45]